MAVCVHAVYPGLSRGFCDPPQLHARGASGALWPRGTLVLPQPRVSLCWRSAGLCVGVRHLRPRRRACGLGWGRLLATVGNYGLPATHAGFPFYAHLCVRLSLCDERELEGCLGAGSPVCRGKTLFASESLPPLPNGPPATMGSSLPPPAARLVGQPQAVPALKHFLFLLQRSQIWGGRRPAPSVCCWTCPKAPSPRPGAVGQ